MSGRGSGEVRGNDDGDVRAKQQLRFDDELNFLVRDCLAREVRKGFLDLGSPWQAA